MTDDGYIELVEHIMKVKSLKRKLKPYIICMYANDLSKRFALDRGYRLMKDVDIDSCMIGDIVQVDSQSGIGYDHPAWADDLQDTWIILWFNYYD